MTPLECYEYITNKIQGDGTNYTAQDDEALAFAQKAMRKMGIPDLSDDDVCRYTPNLTITESIEWLKALSRKIGQIEYAGLWIYAHPLAEIIDVLMDCDKGTPKKPFGDLDSVPHYRCPNCRSGRIKPFENSPMMPFCECCGQVIDWSEEDEPTGSN